MTDLQDIMARLVTENRQSRERFERIATQTVSAISRGAFDELNTIISDSLGNYREGDEGGGRPVETGDTNGIDGNAVTPTTPA